VRRNNFIYDENTKQGDYHQFLTQGYLIKQDIQSEALVRIAATTASPRSVFVPDSDVLLPS